MIRKLIFIFIENRSFDTQTYNEDFVINMLVSYLSFLFDEFELVVICAIEIGQPKRAIFTCIALPM